jgi:FkbM family methyltransferase
MRKVFIDGGANACHQDYDKKIISEDFEIHAFEPNPIFASAFKKKPAIKYYQKSLWNKNEQKILYKGPHDNGFADSITRSDFGKGGINTECVDCSQFIYNNFNTKDQIILRLDIEGAEYAVMNHLIETGAADLINEFWIEFHIQPGFYENGALKKHLAEQHLGKIKPYLKESNKLKDERGGRQTFVHTKILSEIWRE